MSFHTFSTMFYNAWTGIEVKLWRNRKSIISQTFEKISSTLYNLLFDILFVIMKVNWLLFCYKERILLRSNSNTFSHPPLTRQIMNLYTNGTIFLGTKLKKSSKRKSHTTPEGCFVSIDKKFKNWTLSTRVVLFNHLSYKSDNFKKKN